jgi:hypothetical protein
MPMHDRGLSLWQVILKVTLRRDRMLPLPRSFNSLAEPVRMTIDLAFHLRPCPNLPLQMSNFMKFLAPKKEARSPSCGERPVIYLDESIVNWWSLPDNWVAKSLFWLTGSAPGLKINRIYLSLLCSDKQAVARTVLKALAGDPAIVPAHGSPLLRSGDAARVRSLIEPLATSAQGRINLSSDI